MLSNEEYPVVSSFHYFRHHYYFDGVREEIVLRVRAEFRVDLPIASGGLF